MRKAFFITEREAREWIAKEFGEDVVLKPDSFTDDMLNGCEVDEYPYSWSGESSAFNVNFGEACVGYWESADAVFQLIFKSAENEISYKYDAACRADKALEILKEIAERLNIGGKIIVKDNFDNYDEVFIVPDDEEPEGSFEEFCKQVQKELHK
ncbi:MAG: hypothetical protein K2M45_08265 [Muribaculaceae bacterium]|nr:hypothetical protein [Muribaculaceae bacterium]